MKFKRLICVGAAGFFAAGTCSPAILDGSIICSAEQDHDTMAGYEYDDEFYFSPSPGVTDNSIELIWSHPEYGNFKIYQKADGEFVEIFDTKNSDDPNYKGDIDGGRYTVTGLRSSSSYTFMVGAMVWDGEPSVYSRPLTFKTEPSKVVLKSARASSNAIRLTWKKTKCDGYKLQVYDNHNFKWVTRRTVGKNVTSARISGRKPHRKYKVRVQAFTRIPKSREQYIPSKARHGRHTKVLWGKASKAVTVRTK